MIAIKDAAPAAPPRPEAPEIPDPNKGTPPGLPRPAQPLPVPQDPNMPGWRPDIGTPRDPRRIPRRRP